jgi:membrane protease YdiL (CAAX protease family)
MIGPIALCLSWLLLRFEGKGLVELGFNSPRVRAGQFLAGLLLAGSVVALQQLGLSVASGVDWQLNPEMDVALALHGLRVNVNSVLYEEFLFRGYLLYQAIRWFGTTRGVLIGAAAFGIYHWFSYGIIGEPVMMAFIFVLTGGFGLMLGLAFAKTKSMAAPIGLHLGWNAVANLGFSGGPFGPGLWVTSNGAPHMEVPGVLGLVLGLGLPVGLVVVTCWYLLRGRVNDGTVATEDSNAATDA